MIIEEAEWLRDRIDKYKPSRILDVGSSDFLYRYRYQKFIGRMLFWCQDVTHLDIKRRAGVDIVADMCDERLPERIGTFDLVLCASMLEHVEDSKAAMRNMVALSHKWVAFTVPHVWPLHDNPIDNGWRPNAVEFGMACEEVGIMLQDCDLVYDGRDDKRNCMVVTWGSVDNHNLRQLVFLMCLASAPLTTR